MHCVVEIHVNLVSRLRVFDDFAITTDVTPSVVKIPSVVGMESDSGTRGRQPETPLAPLI
jgi:hypothetical protein